MTTIRNLLSIITCSISFSVIGETLKGNHFANPTGTYRTHLDNPEGKKLPQGTIKVKLIGQNRIAISLIMQNGKPLLRSGRLMDTVVYKRHSAIFRNAEIDSTCKIVFRFTLKSIQVKQISKFTNYSCDFANGVNADGLYHKESSKVPSFSSAY